MSSEPAFRLYNTMSRSVEAFAPADGRTVRMYTCGPTVYNPAHLGNFRTFLFEDLLRRTARLRGWAVFQVMNLTDVDDKIIARAVQQGQSIRHVTDPVVETFHADRRFLRIEDAEVYPRATEYIPEMVALVERLMQRGVAYQADDGSIYFAIARFPRYGRLSRLDTRELKAGARVAQDDYTKENAQDFALWKAAKPEDEVVGAAWDAPFGRGRPGWHLECSAMAMKEIGETLDIHCGGVDLIFPHHEDEIAQSEAATGVTFSRHWCHGEFLNIEGAKMAKRVGNVWTVADMKEQGVSAAAFRHFVFTTHYRKTINLSGEAIEQSMNAVERVGIFARRLEEATGATPELAAAADEAERAFRAALSDDLNAPEALGALGTFINRANAELDRRGSDTVALKRARSVFTLMAVETLDIAPIKRVVALGGEIHAGSTAAGNVGILPTVEVAEGVAFTDDDRAWLAERHEARKQARARRDFAAADSIRREIESRGFEVQDTAGGTTYRKAA